MGEICKRVQCNSLYGGCIECNFLLIHSCFFFSQKERLPWDFKERIAPIAGWQGIEWDSYFSAGK